jgi:hypothetical protein
MGGNDILIVGGYGVVGRLATLKRTPPQRVLRAWRVP